MIDMEDTFERLKKIDIELAEDYLYQMSLVKSLQGTLTAVRELLGVRPGESIIKAVEAHVADPAVIVPEYAPVTRTRSSKEERDEVKRRLMSLGVNFKAKDSTKRLMKKLQSVEGTPVEIKETPTMRPQTTQSTSKQKNIINGW